MNNKYTVETIMNHPDYPFYFICPVCFQHHYKINDTMIGLRVNIPTERKCDLCILKE